MPGAAAIASCRQSLSASKVTSLRTCPSDPSNALSLRSDGSQSWALKPRSTALQWGRLSGSHLTWRPSQIRAGQGGGRGKRPDRTSKESRGRQPNEGPQRRNPVQPPGEFPELLSSRVATEIDEGAFNERIKAIKAAQTERPKPQQSPLAAIDYDAPKEKKDEQPAKPWVKAVSIAGALILIGSFALSDLVLQNLGFRDKNPSAEVQELPKEEMERLQKQAKTFEETLQQQPLDAEALEGAGVSYAEMGDFKKAGEYLDKLVKAKPDDVEALRLLAEVKLAGQDYSGAAYTYRRAMRASPRESLGLLKGLADALISDKRPNEATGEILNARERIRTSEASAGTSANGADERIDPVQVDLLLAKAYQSWGKIPDALAVYDGLIASFPDDFRPYLAKGILLKQQKLEGEAERNFVKARFLAPEAGKQLVDRLTGR